MSIETFYSKILELQSALLNHIANNENNRSVMESKRKLYLEMCLNTFLTGVRGNLGATIRSMRPNDLSTAYAHLIKEKNITNREGQDIKPKQQHYNNSKWQDRPQNQYKSGYKTYNNNQSQPNRQNAIDYRPYDNRQTQNKFRNNNQHQHPQIKTSQSSMTRNTYNNNNSGYQKQLRNLKVEEINYINDSNEETDKESCNIDDYPNFRAPASSTRNP